MVLEVVGKVVFLARRGPGIGLGTLFLLWSVPGLGVSGLRHRLRTYRE